MRNRNPPAEETFALNCLHFYNYGNVLITANLNDAHRKRVNVPRDYYIPSRVHPAVFHVFFFPSLVFSVLSRSALSKFKRDTGHWRLPEILHCYWLQLHPSGRNRRRTDYAGAQDVVCFELVFFKFVSLVK